MISPEREWPGMLVPAIQKPKKEQGRIRQVKTLIGENLASQEDSIKHVIFAVNSGKIVSVTPVVNSDEELNQLTPWIQACLILGDLIRPSSKPDRRAAA